MDPLAADRTSSQGLPAQGQRPDASRPLTPDYFTAVAEVLIGSADAALYRAKKLGGAQVCPAEPVSWPPLPS